MIRKYLVRKVTTTAIPLGPGFSQATSALSAVGFVEAESRDRANQLAAEQFPGEELSLIRCKPGIDYKLDK